MNIFATHPEYSVSALWLDDKRINKMITESAQMLSTNIRIITNDDPELCANLYKPSHSNHPCNIWIRESRSNFKWVLRHAYAMSILREESTGKFHKATTVLRLAEPLAFVFPEKGLTPFANCAANDSLNVSFKHIPDPHLAYQKYLIARWLTDKRIPEWKHNSRGCPDWAFGQLYENYGEAIHS